ncbi:MAG TPA: alpha/beta fold hydrolase [Myxococcota bacterium]|nr:alpha/beta fold hydrolase [Myxococcota bacterium]
MRSRPVADFPVSRQPVWRLALQETLAFAASGLLLPFGASSSQWRSPRLRAQRTVVLVHGYLSNRSAMFPLAAYLRVRGFDQVLSFNYPSTQGVERGARELREFLRRRVRGGRIDLVCHSLGGLVARAYLQELGGARRVDRCITLGTPHSGTYNAYWLTSRVGAELRPDSRVLARLRKSRAAAARVRFTSIVAGSDNLVIPRVFARHERVVHVPDLGHVAMLFSPTVLSHVVAALSARGASPAVHGH